MNRIELKQRARENVRKDKFTIILLTLIVTAILSASAYGYFSLPLGLLDFDFLTVAPTVSSETGVVTPMAKEQEEFDLDDFFDEDGNFDAKHYYGYDESEGDDIFSSPFQNPFAPGNSDNYSYYYDDYSDDYVDFDLGNAGLSLLIFLLAGALTAGLLRYHLKVWRGEEGEFKDLFSKFNKDFPRITKMYLLQTLFVFLWSLLLIVPGIIMAIAYSQAYFLMLDDPTLSAMDALNKSKELMKGKKWDYFVIYLSFIGWGLLGILTLGILFLWINPYMLQTLTGYYNEVIRPEVLTGGTEKASSEEPKVAPSGRIIPE